ncbi:ABC transporter permease [Mucilaginibacter flavidus]|uniref:ABC transporter permease n=1 Tax=Mucilaginibacter flavidus TaxID=2949309 RepID=UPI0020920827|nr:ABC transporter permease [Mucilaginibacter flavidus]MCO5945550.1 ABC transporter permease [Mucilaginibacter flavidus]
MTDLSPSQRTWKVFKRNKIAVGGLVLIVFMLIVAILGYLIMPDQTPLANNMTIQLSIKKPGSQFTILRLRKTEPVDTVNIFSKMLFGQPSFYKEIPITGYHVKGDSIYVSEYIGTEDKPEKKVYKLQPPSPLKGEPENLQTPHLGGRGAWGAVIHRTYWLGTDIYGRDLLSRLILGTRVSLSVGLMSVIISMLLGVTIGAVAGYFGGWIDGALSWLMNILWALPALLLVIAISFALGKGLWQIFIAVGLSMWVEVARLVRGQVLSLKQVEYIEAARSLGFNNARIISKHILPNIIGPILVLASSNFASAILLEAGLSFLGFGAQPPMPTWGSMIKEHYGYIVMDSAYLAIIPGLAIMLLVYAFNLVTVGLRDAFDIKSQSTRF